MSLLFPSNWLPRDALYSSCLTESFRQYCQVDISSILQMRRLRPREPISNNAQILKTILDAWLPFNEEYEEVKAVEPCESEKRTGFLAHVPTRYAHQRRPMLRRGVKWPFIPPWLLKLLRSSGASPIGTERSGQILGGQGETLSQHKRACLP